MNTVLAEEEVLQALPGTAPEILDELGFSLPSFKLINHVIDLAESLVKQGKAIAMPRMGEDTHYMKKA